ncbi:Pantoate--beta-alanine ligase [Camellia lanceoleosa]|uniref:Pantoate--beta-alanine ligase n=1 Tax=Camellia lanceoleosa TaxID=1840588 RepID=A0ACC0HIX3_9ERIC|nr:Pantoate--beta-alanine ligase [Camellia lanceoleosa]
MEGSSEEKKRSGKKQKEASPLLHLYDYEYDYHAIHKVPSGGGPNVKAKHAEICFLKVVHYSFLSNLIKRRFGQSSFMIKEAHKHTSLTVISIYLINNNSNPPHFTTYPSFDFQGDAKKLKTVPGGVDVVFHPHNLYEHGRSRSRDDGGVEREEKAEEDEERREKEGGWLFLRGVATVIVAKLFNIVELSLMLPIWQERLPAVADYFPNDLHKIGDLRMVNSEFTIFILTDDNIV